MTEQIKFEDLQKIVWNFADLLRDKGKGSVEDYARITIPTLAFKRILDLTEEYLGQALEADKVLLASGVLDVRDSLQAANKNNSHFYNENTLTSNPNGFNTMLLTWSHLMNYEENPNKEVRTITLPYNQIYTTTATDFIGIMFEIIGAFGPQLNQLFDSCDYRLLLVQKEIVKYSDFYKICHDTVEKDGKNQKHSYSGFSLTNFKFDNTHVSSDIFADMYMDLIGRFAEDSGKKGGEFFTPTLLSSNIPRFLKLKKIALALKSGHKSILNIGDPTSGSNTFLMYVKKAFDIVAKSIDYTIPKEQIFFYGQELKSFQAALGTLNMVFHGLGDRYNKGILLQNQISSVIDNYNNGIGTKRGELDVVLANPPYGVKDYGEEYAIATKNSDPRWKYGVPKKSDGEYAFLLTILDLLNTTGQAAVVMPLGTLFRDSSANFRKQLVEADVVEGLITLPANMFLTTSIPVVIWILNKDKDAADKNKIFMVNASQDFKKVGKFNEWQPDIAVEAYSNRNIETNYSGYVDTAMLEKNKYNFSVQRYFSKEKEKEVIDIMKVEKEILELEEKISDNKKDIADLMKQIFALETGEANEQL